MRERWACKAAALVLGAALPVWAGSERLYVANTGGASISVVDPVARKQLREIAVSRQPHALAPSADGKWWFVASEADDVLDVVDRSTERVVKRIPLGKRPNNLAL